MASAIIAGSDCAATLCRSGRSQRAIAPTAARTRLDWCRSRADLTVTFHRAKLGHYSADAASIGAAAGRSSRSAWIAGCRGQRSARLSDRKVGPARSTHPRHLGQAAATNSPTATPSSSPAPPPTAAPPGSPPAARCGSAPGLVTLGAPAGGAARECRPPRRHHAARRSTGADDLAALLQDDRINALCLGPGLGLERAAELVPVVLAAKRATVLDADALTWLSRTARMADRPDEEPDVKPYAEPTQSHTRTCIGLRPHPPCRRVRPPVPRPRRQARGTRHQRPRLFQGRRHPRGREARRLRGALQGPRHRDRRPLRALRHQLRRL